MANVTVMGGVATEYGLKTAQKVQLKHNQEVAEALLNISGVGTENGEPVHQDEPRPAYVPSHFPKMLYKPIRGEDGQKIVLHADEMKSAIADGWREEPYEFPQIAVLDPQTEKKALADKLQAAESQNIQMAELMKSMAARLEALESKKK